MRGKVFGTDAGGFGTATCPVCGGSLPEQARGRPRAYCSRTCSERARQRRRQAARLIEYAERVERCIGRPGFGSEQYLRGRAAALRAGARELLVSVGELPSAS